MVLKRDFLFSNNLIVIFFCRELKSTMGRTSTIVGSPCWMAPEVVSSSYNATEEGAYDNRADVWALGETCTDLTTHVERRRRTIWSKLMYWAFIQEILICFSSWDKAQRPESRYTSHITSHDFRNHRHRTGWWESSLPRHAPDEGPIPNCEEPTSNTLQASKLVQASERLHHWVREMYIHIYLKVLLDIC